MPKTEVEVLEEHLEKLIKFRDSMKYGKHISDNDVHDMVAISREIRETVHLLYSLVKL